MASPRTQQRWLDNFSCIPGVNDHFISIIVKKLSGCELQDRNTMLCFDEVDIKNKYEYDSRSKTVYGNSKKMQVVMARGLVGKWKQIIYFDFSTQMSKELIERIIIACEKKGLRIRGLTFDLGNHKFQSETEIMKSVHGSFRHSMTNPTDPSRKVYMFPDIPHMIKLMRNHCLDHGLAFLNDTGEYCTLKMEDFKEVLLKDGKELKLCPKLKPIHLTVQGSMRQRVCLATQLFSHTVAMALLYHQGKRGETKSKAILTINNYCDTMNSRRMYDAVPYRCGLGIHQDLQIESLLKMKSLVENMKFCDNMDKKSLKPFQKGFLISIESTFALLKEAQVTVQIYYH